MACHMISRFVKVSNSTLDATKEKHLNIDHLLVRVHNLVGLASTLEISRLSSHHQEPQSNVTDLVELTSKMKPCFTDLPDP